MAKRPTLIVSNPAPENPSPEPSNEKVYLFSFDEQCRIYPSEKTIIDLSAVFEHEAKHYGMNPLSIDDYIGELHELTHSHFLSFGREAALRFFKYSIKNFSFIIRTGYEQAAPKNEFGFISSINRRLKNIDAYAAAHPGASVSDYILELIPEIKTLDGYVQTTLAESGHHSVSITDDVEKTVSDEIMPLSKVAEEPVHKRHFTGNSNEPSASIKWGKRDKQKYKGNNSVFQFIADYHPDLRTTGGLNDRDHSLYQVYRTAIKERSELTAKGENAEPLPAGFKLLLDRGTKSEPYTPPPKKELQAARALLARDRRGRKRAEDRER